MKTEGEYFDLGGGWGGLVGGGRLIRYHFTLDLDTDRWFHHDLEKLKGKQIEL